MVVGEYLGVELDDLFLVGQAAKDDADGIVRVLRAGGLLVGRLVPLLAADRLVVDGHAVLLHLEPGLDVAEDQGLGGDRAVEDGQEARRAAARAVDELEAGRAQALDVGADAEKSVVSTEP